MLPAFQTTETLWIILTRTCNLACSYCYQGDHLVNKLPPHLRRTMTDEVMEKGLDWAANWAQRGLQIAWYGGEPTLNFPIIKKWMPLYKERFAAAGKQVRFSITTNGTRMTDEIIAFLKEYEVGILLSLDGPPKLHNMTRVHFDGRGSWDEIPLKKLVETFPNLEVAWQLDPDPKRAFTPEDLDELMSFGLTRINFNLQWLSDWPAEAQMRLFRFMRHAGRLMLQGKLHSNFKSKLFSALTVDAKMDTPCGTGLHMLALTPEGYLYPSQEMAFTVFEPGRAKGTAEHYRAGNVFNTPVIDAERLADISQIRTSQMKTPPGYDCNNCVANSVSIGGCHCRYVGQLPKDPSYRYDVPEGYCASMQPAMTGLLAAAAIERWVRPVDFVRAQVASGAIDLPKVRGRDGKMVALKVVPVDQVAEPRPHRPIDLSDIADRLDTIQAQLNGSQARRLPIAAGSCGCKEK